MSLYTKDHSLVERRNSVDNGYGLLALSLFIRRRKVLRLYVNMVQHSKHEIIPCERCGTRIECKANAYTKCQCSVVQLTINEVQYISELYDGCMCANCLLELQGEYREMMGIENSKKEQLLDDIREGLKEVKEIMDGKSKPYNMSDLLDNK